MKDMIAFNNISKRIKEGNYQAVGFIEKQLLKTYITEFVSILNSGNSNNVDKAMNDISETLIGFSAGYILMVISNYITIDTVIIHSLDESPILSKLFEKASSSENNDVAVSLIEEIKQINNQYNLNVSFTQNEDDIINEFQNKVDLEDKISWNALPVNQKLSEAFFEKFQDKLNFVKISMNQTLTESFIEKFQDKVYWPYISTYQNLSESFIEKFQGKVNWERISAFQKLSEQFVRKFSHKIDWPMVFKHQDLSEEFTNKVKLFL